MLKAGIYLFFSSTIGVAYRLGDYAYSMHPYIKCACFFGLFAALACFLGTYIQYEMPHYRRTFTRRTELVKSGAWKLSSMA